MNHAVNQVSGWTKTNLTSVTESRIDSVHSQRAHDQARAHEQRVRGCQKNHSQCGGPAGAQCRSRNRDFPPEVASVPATRNTLPRSQRQTLTEGRLLWKATRSPPIFRYRDVVRPLRRAYARKNPSRAKFEEAVERKPESDAVIPPKCIRRNRFPNPTKPERRPNAAVATDARTPTKSASY